MHKFALPVLLIGLALAGCRNNGDDRSPEQMQPGGGTAPAATTTASQPAPGGSAG